MPEADGKKRVSIPVETIREIQQACYEIDDDRRWLIALISDTGMRLAEAAGLHIDDLHLAEEIPFVDIKPSGAYRNEVFLVINNASKAINAYQNCLKHIITVALIKDLLGYSLPIILFHG